MGVKRCFVTAAFVFAGVSFCFAESQQIIGPFGTLNDRDSSSVIADYQAQDLLNVDITPGGKSVKKRKGYGQAFATTVATSPIHGTYEFFDSNGNDVTLAFNDVYLTASINGASPSVISSASPLAATYQCIDSQGFAYCANTARTSIIKTNGVTATSQPILSTGTMVSVTPDRLVISGISSAPNRIDFSAAADFTSWSTGIAGTSAFQFTITAPGSSIKHITYAFNRLMWFKDSSFGYILPGATAADWVVKTISPVVGTVDNSSVYWQDVLYFRGQDGHIYSYDGTSLQKISKEISTTISLTQRRTGNSWTQTTAADFGASSTTPSMYLDTTTTPGQVYLATNTALTSFEDSIAPDFGAGSSFVNVDTTTLSGSVLLSVFTGPTFAAYQQYGADSTDLGDNSGGSCPFQVSQSFSVGSTPLIFSSVTLRLRNTTSGPDARFYLYNDNSNSPGSQIDVGLNDIPTTIGTSYVDVNVNFTPITLSTNTRYWLRMTSSLAPFAGGISIVWAGTNGSFSETSKYGTTCSDVTKNAKYKIYGTTVSYYASGSFISRIFDVGFTTSTWLWSWGNLTSITVIPSNTTITYETQTSTSATGVFDTLLPVVPGANPDSTVREFIRYKATLTTTNVSTSPILQELSIAMSARIRPLGTFYSQVRNAPNLTSWDSFTANTATTINFSTETFYIRSSTNIFSIGSATPSWTSVTNGAIPSVSTGTYFQIRDDFITASFSKQATLFDFTQNWFEGFASDKSYATYFNDSILFSVAYGASASSNNRILKYDLLNQGWLIYDIPVGGFYLKNLSLYFGSSSSGFVYKYGDTNNDNGAAINAYWKSKDFFGQDPFIEDEVTNISVYGTSVANSSMTVTYVINGSSSTSYIVPLNRSNMNYFNSNKNLPLGLIANSINVKFGNNAADQPFEVIACRLGLNPKPWRPTSQ